MQIKGEKEEEQKIRVPSEAGFHTWYTFFFLFFLVVIVLFPFLFFLWSADSRS